MDSLAHCLDKKLESYELSSLKTILYESCDVARNRQVFEWVNARARREGHVLLEYMIVRNHFKDHKLYLPDEFETALVQAIYFLVRVAEDCVAARQVHGFVRSADVFGMFANKIKRWLAPYESRVVAPAQPASAASWIATIARPYAADWPGVGEVYNAWPAVARVVSLLKDLCARSTHAKCVKSHWAWCMFASSEWVDTLYFGDIPQEIINTYETNLSAAYTWRQAARQGILKMLETAESWESFWSITSQAWTQTPKMEK